MRLGNGSAVAPGELLFLNLNLSQEAYIYLVNQDEKGEAFVLFPLPEQELTNPIPVGQHQLPGLQRGVEVFFQVLNAGLREHFLLYVSPTRLVELESLLAAIPRAEPGRPVDASFLGGRSPAQCRRPDDRSTVAIGSHTFPVRSCPAPGGA